MNLTYAAIIGNADSRWYIGCLRKEKNFTVIQVPSLNWPTLLEIPSRRFRLLVAADISGATTQAVADFAFEALIRGVVYFCAWGPDCERFHDIVDEVLIADHLSEQKFASPNENDVIMTTWHSNETLEEALEFLAIGAVPTDGFAPDSNFRVVICLGNSDWGDTAKKFLESAEFFV